MVPWVRWEHLENQTKRPQLLCDDHRPEENQGGGRVGPGGPVVPRVASRGRSMIPFFERHLLHLI